METKKKHKVLIKGPVAPEFIANSIANHSKKTGIGAHSIFLGQVRADSIQDKTVVAIDYSCYEEMAENEFYKIREEAFSKYDLTCMHIFHSVGTIKAGEICLFVFVSSKRRKQVFQACEEIVEQIKTRVPIWGKELFEDSTYVWKENTP